MQKGKLRIIDNGFAVYCPGCETHHTIDQRWQFNGDFENPTFNPSLLVNGYDEKRQCDFVCHSFITDGKWRFLSDCTHELKSQTVDLANVGNS